MRACPAAEVSSAILAPVNVLKKCVPALFHGRRQKTWFLPAPANRAPTRSIRVGTSRCQDFHFVESTYPASTFLTLSINSVSVTGLTMYSRAPWRSAHTRSVSWLLLLTTMIGMRAVDGPRDSVRVAQQLSIAG